MNLEMIWLKTVNVVEIDLHCVANSVLNQGLLQPETVLKMNFNVKSTGSANQLLENQGFQVVDHGAIKQKITMGKQLCEWLSWM